MKRFSLALVLLGLVCAMPCAAQEATIKIAPHRALYKMSLARVKNGSAIHDVSGTMLFDWADACDGWAIQQHMKLHFIYAEGDEQDLSSNVVTWESKDGKKYNFTIRRTSNGQPDESFKGRASLSEMGGGTVDYAIPKDRKEVALTAGVMFPSAHTEMILRKALAGEKMFTKLVFDGSDEAGSANISAFIGGKQDKIQETDLSQDLKKNPLLDQPAWPVRLAFYKPEAQTTEPDYEMDLTLQANGVARSMTIDYGDFAVTGVLASVEPATQIPCSDVK